jgi:hypothetical protein
MKITIETEEKTQVSTKTTPAAQVVEQIDGNASPPTLEPTEIQQTIPTSSVEKTGAVDAGQPPSWLVDAIESSASSKPVASQEIVDAGSGPSK